ncbi:MAG TPA: hypothetical protein VK829_20265, partial [Terriglobales bacterium]|nr:hypothetical protein [Terriglobales bacterium]
DHPRLAGDHVNAIALMIVHSSCKQQVPPLRIAIDKVNRNAPVGMTDFCEAGRCTSLRTTPLKTFCPPDRVS